VSADIRYEQTDARARPIVRYSIGLLIFTAVSAGIAYAALYGFREMGRRTDRPRPAMALDDSRRLPVEPRLQVHPTLDAAEMRRLEREQLTTYGWVDQQRGIVRIPVDRAIELLAARGLPSRAAAPQPGAAPAPAASPSSAPTPPTAPPAAVPETRH
jgi:hypothetical protein